MPRVDNQYGGLKKYSIHYTMHGECGEEGKMEVWPSGEGNTPQHSNM